MEITELKKLTLADIGKGALEEMFQGALAKVIENIQDLNTSDKAKRIITAKITLLPAETRNSARMLLNVSTTLPSPEPFETQIYLGIEDGEFVAAEFNPRQMLLFDPPKPNVALIKKSESSQDE